MKKWIGIAAILVCCGIYAMVKLSISQYEDAKTLEEETQSTGRTDAGNTGEETREVVSASPATAAQVEAVTRAFSELQTALESEDYERAWELMTQSAKDHLADGIFWKFEQEMADKGAVLATATTHPDSAIAINGRVGLLVTIPSEEQNVYFFFIQEQGQWKWDDVRPAERADTSDADHAQNAAPGEDSGSPVPPAEVEAVTKAFSEFLSALESEDYEQAWKLTLESFKSQGSFEKFKEGVSRVRAELVKATIRPESATNIGGRVRLLVTAPSLGDDHMFFVQEDGQWKLKLDE